MKNLEALCHMAAESKRYWPFLEAHCKLWFIMDKLGMLNDEPVAPLSPLVP